MEASGSAPGPGWYPDPNDPSTNRYWDGAKWTDSRAPAQATTGAPGEKEQDATGIIIAGYIFAVLIPLVGFIIGLTQINKNRHGLWVVLASIAVVVFFVILAVATSDSSSTNGYRY